MKLEDFVAVNDLSVVVFRKNIQTSSGAKRVCKLWKTCGYSSGLVFSAPVAGVYTVLAYGLAPNRELMKQLEEVFRLESGEIYHFSPRKANHLPVAVPVERVALVHRWGARKWRSVGGLEVSFGNGKLLPNHQEGQTPCRFPQPFSV